MRSYKWPKMFSSNSSNIWKSSEYLSATKQNSILLLQSEKNELFGDPYYGTLFKHYLFDQNSYALKDVVIDIVYTQLAMFIPQIRVKRDDIEIIQDKEKGKLYCNFSGINQIDYQPNTYNLVLYEDMDL